MYQQILEKLSTATNTILLTPNRRLAGYLLRIYAQQQTAKGLQAWQTPQILPLVSWLEDLYKTSVLQEPEPKLLLKPAQVSEIWNSIIAKATQEQELLRLTGTATKAVQAYETLQLWNMQLTSEDFNINEDSLNFYAWAQEYTELCTSNNWLCPSKITAYVTENLVNLNANLPQKVLLVGFDDIPPAYQNFLEQLQQNNCEFELENPRIKNSASEKIACYDEEQELYSMANWAKQTFLNNPGATIACVIPNLASIRPQANLIFKEVLQDSVPFNMSGGKALADFPIIQVALNILRLGCDDIEQKQISNILLSPFISKAETNRLVYASLDSQLRELMDNHINHLDLENLICEFSATNNCAENLSQAIQEFCQYWGELPKNASMKDWCNHFIKILNIFGWPGERTLDSLEYQVLCRFEALLAELAEFDQIVCEEKYTKALQLLTRLCQDTVFQGKTVDHPVQALGMLEAAGMPFDFLWMSNCHSGSLPAMAEPNPFIPVQLQRKYAMPHSSADRELHFSKQIIQRLQSSVPQLIFSYPQWEADRMLIPSPIITEFSTLAPEKYLFESQFEKQYPSLSLEKIDDQYGPEVTGDATVSGGTNIFKLQAACPFRAFAELRLDADELYSKQLGLNALDRGSLIHKILETIWHNLQSSEVLQQLTTEQLQQHVENQVNNCLTKYKSPSKTYSNQEYLKIEKQRLTTLICDWLELEKTRAEFRISELEQQHIVKVKDLQVKLQIDRIDEVADGGYFIIDYKTGAPKVSDWFGDYIKEPQLPLYCITNDKPIAGMFFAQLSKAELAFKGFSQVDNIPKTKSFEQINHSDGCEDWQEQQELWRTQLEDLAEQYQQGFSARLPQADACNYCRLQPLCRVYEDA